MSESITIDRRFCGPPDSAHGGYACGRVAEFVSGPAEVTLRQPPPLGRSLRIELREGSATLLDGKTLVAEGTPSAFELELPEPVADMEPDQVFDSFTLFDSHWYPTCFGCGPDREAGDGLRLFPRRVPGRDLLAVPWTPEPSLNDGEGHVRPEFVWAALDCPSGFGAGIAPDRIALLGKLALKSLAPVPAGQRQIILGWSLGNDGRKIYGASALFSESGEVRAYARATWVLVR